MKKQTISKLKLKKASVSSLNSNAIKGGDLPETFGCPSNNLCETIDYTRCRGEYNCQIYPYRTDQTF